MPSLIPLIEAAAADTLRSYGEVSLKRQPLVGAKVLSLGLGVACFAGVGNPLSTVKGLGPRIHKEDLDKIEDFYAGSGVEPVLELAPWVEERELAELRVRGYEIVAEEDVMLRATGSGHTPQAAVERVDVEEWAELVSQVFGGEVSEHWMEVSRAMGELPGAALFGLREEGRLVAGAQLLPGLRLGSYTCDATLAEFRQRGYQGVLIQARLALAAELGLPWSTCEVARASSSQRNYERCGFERVYTRTHWKRT